MKNAKRMIVLSEEEYKKLKGCQQSKLYNKAIVYKQEMNRKFQKPQNFRKLKTNVNASKFVSEFFLSKRCHK